MWDKTIHGGAWIGQNKYYALRFSNIANSLGFSIRDLAERIFVRSDDELLKFFQELGDIEQQNLILKKFGDDVDKYPDNLLFRMAVTAGNRGDIEKSVELYTKYIEKHPYASAAYGNRAGLYKVLGKKQEARKDYEKSLSIAPNDSLIHTNYANFLQDIGETDNATSHLKEAVNSKNEAYPQAYYLYGVAIEEENPDEALIYFETASEIATSHSSKELYTRKLGESQESSGDFSQAIRSYKLLIQVNPTSYRVREWKGKIANLRLQIDAIEKRRTTRDRLREKEEVMLGILTKDFLTAAGLNIDIIAPQLFLCDGEKARLPKQLAMALLDTPQLTALAVRDAIEEINEYIPMVSQIVIMTSADVLDFDARMQLLAYRTSDKQVALITSLEAQEAFLRGDEFCVEIIDRAFRRITDISDPFERKIPIKDRVDFFGRDKETQKIRSLVQNQQPFGLFGIHKIGKSSLLNRVGQALAAYSPDMTVLPLELSAEFHNSSGVYRRILKSFSKEIDIPKGDITTEQFRKKVIQYQYQMNLVRPGHRLLFVFDECAYLIPDSSGKGGLEDFLEFIGFLKSFKQEMDWFNFALCGRNPAISRTHRWEQGENPFISFITEIFLGPLTLKETSELITSLGQIALLEFDNETIDYIYSITGGHPTFTRLLGSQITKKVKSGDVTKKNIDAAVQSYLGNNSERQLLIKIYQESLDVIEKEIVKKLVINKKIRRSEVLSAYTDSKMKRQVRDAINNLIDTTVISEDDNRILKIRYELLRIAIEQDLSELGEI